MRTLTGAAGTKRPAFQVGPSGPSGPSKSQRTRRSYTELRPWPSRAEEATEPESDRSMSSAVKEEKSNRSK